MASILRRLYQSGGWINQLLLGTMLIILVAATDEVHWVSGTGMLYTILVLVFFLSIPLTRFPARFALSANLVAAQAISFLVVAEAMPLPRTLGNAGLGPIERLSSLAGQTGDWLSQIASGGASANNNMFLLFLGVLLALVIVTSVWSTYYWHNGLGAVLPIGAALLFNCSSAGSGAWWVVFYFMLTLILLMRLFLRAQEQRWDKKRIDYSDELFFDVFFTGVGVSVAIALLVFLLPGASDNPLYGTFWGSFGHSLGQVEDTINRLFAGVRPGGTNQATVLPGRETVIIGTQAVQGDDVQIYVATAEKEYWRGNVYNFYTGQGWINQSDDTLDREPNQPLPEGSGTLKASHELTQVVTLQNPRLDVLFIAEQPKSVNQPYSAHMFAGDSTILSQRRGLFGFGGYSTYEAVSLVSTATPDQLRNAASDYPETFTQRYLQLPETLPGRVRSLTAQIIANSGAHTTYDKVAAIEQYLRTLSYASNIQQIPAGRDAVDYFLFDSKSGWSDHFATAMVVMLRSAGIPARLATGYDSGTWDGSRYVVKTLDTHSWPEAYFPGYGWIEFEPTPNHELLHQPLQASTAYSGEYSGDDELNDDESNMDHITAPSTKPDQAQGLQLSTPVLVGITVLLILLLLMFSWRGYDAYTRSKLTPVHFVRRIYADMSRMAELLGRPQQANQTPAEYTNGLAGSLPLVKNEIHRIGAHYSESRYSNHNLSPQIRTETEQAWRRARRFFWQLLPQRIASITVRFKRTGQKRLTGNNR